MRFVLLLLIAPTFLFSQKKIEKQLPPGYSWVKARNLMISTHEITLNQWYDFIKEGGDGDDRIPEFNDLNKKCLCSKNDNDELVLINPTKVNYRDTTYLEVKDGKPGKKRKSVEPCSDMPITGISYESALAYCEYLNSKMDEEYPDLNLTFRLPTKEEMNLLLKDTFSDWEPSMDNYKSYENGINMHGCAIYNHHHESWCDNNVNMKYQFGYGIPMGVSYFFPDVNGLYDLMGNVAEMTNEKGIALGGSCIHSAAHCQPGAVNQYNGPQPWLGFRVVSDFNP
jgi:formylglycine-generating enzyme required for sulfatase activity